MTNPLFPVLGSSVRPDSSGFEIGFEDPAMRNETEGGYVYTRARHKRRPRMTFKVAYKLLTNADKTLLQNFWNTTVFGGSVIFDWLNHQDGLTYAVRFKDPLSFKYTGRGNLQQWDCSFSVEEA